MSVAFIFVLLRFLGDGGFARMMRGAMKRGWDVVVVRWRSSCHVGWTCRLDSVGSFGLLGKE